MAGLFAVLVVLTIVVGLVASVLEAFELRRSRADRRRQRAAVHTTSAGVRGEWD